MLLATTEKRRERNHEKIRILLNFLKEETYSDFKTLMLLFGFKAHPPLIRLLQKVETMGLIQKHIISTRASKISLWGITNDGLSIVLTPEDSLYPSRFEPSRLSGWSLEHHLDNQRVRLILEKKGATGWINGDRSSFLSQYRVKHRPDGLISLPDGRMIAVETERNIKTKARYQAIMASHLLARTEKHWFFVFYVLPDDNKKRALSLMFDTIPHVIVNNQHVTLEDKHRNVFRFYTIDELIALELTNYA